MVVFPLLVTVVAGLFAVRLAQQFVRRRRSYQLIWTFSLVCGALAGASFLLFLVSGRQAAWFRAYYIFGALLMAAYLGMGSIALLAPRRWSNLALLVLLPLSVVGALLVAAAPLNPVALRSPNIEAGTNAISGPAIAFVAGFNTFGAVAVIGGAVYSALRVLRGSGPVRLLASNGLIALGTILASLAGTLARLTGAGSAFWVLLAIGLGVLFVGFHLASLPRRPHHVSAEALAET